MWFGVKLLMKTIFKTTLLCAIVFLSVTHVFAFDVKQNEQIIKIINAFKAQDKVLISTLITYPLNRQTPAPAINNQQELVNRFDEVFDQNLINLIANSDVENDWKAKGWRGIMFLNGKLWLDGGKIRSINHQTVNQANLKQTIVEQQKLTLHESLRNYKQPILQWETTKFRVRIDDLGQQKFRYASWSLDKSFSDKPDLVLLNGKQDFDGSGGNHYYTFINGKYTYRCDVIVIGTSKSPAGRLSVLKDQLVLLTDDVVEVLK